MAVDTAETTPARTGSARARRRRRWWRRWLARVAAVVLVVVLLAAIGLGVLLLETPSASSAPQRVAAILAEHGAPSDGGAIPAKVADALLATEDSRFYHDPAIDPLGAVRGTWGFLTGDPNQGGATIEVQLAKMLYTPGRSGVLAVLEQGAVALKLDNDFSKRQILAMYLDAAYFGDGAYGVTAASHHYFGLPPAQLSWGQAALIAGLVQAPSAYDPRHHLSAALERRDHVLARLVEVGTLTRAEAKQVEGEALNPVIPFSG